MNDYFHIMKFLKENNLEIEYVYPLRFILMTELIAHGLKLMGQTSSPFFNFYLFILVDSLPFLQVRD